MSKTDTEMERALDDVLPGQMNVTYVNQAGVPESVIDELRGNRDIASAIEAWSQSLASMAEPSIPTLGLFSRTRNQGHKGVFTQFAQCAWAVNNDDILSTLADVVEALTFQKVRFELFDPEEQDVWNQWAGMVDLDSVLRQASRELFKVSQVYVGLWWDKKIVSVRQDKVVDSVKELAKEEKDRQALEDGVTIPPEKKPGRGNYKRTTKFALELPTALTVFEPTKIVPVGALMFGRERFAYIASGGEEGAFKAIFDGEIADGTVRQLIEKKYSPSKSEIRELEAIGVDPLNLWLMKKDAVFRHTLTRASYERFAPVRLRSALPILEMKSHLRASDRASLLGNTNAIIVVTKGSDKLPARPAEIENLQEQVRVIARLPVLVGDHRLHVEIVAPPLDNTLIESRWEVLDSRLVFKALQTFQPTVQGGNSSGGIKETSRIVARGLESRRHMLVRSFEKNIFTAVLDRNEGTLEESPALTFAPKRISVDTSADIIAQILKLRDRGDISRETTLEELDYDQDVEVLRRARERLDYDPVFQSQTPHASPTSNPYAGAAGVVPSPMPGQVVPGQPVVPGAAPAAKGAAKVVAKAPIAAPVNNLGPKGQPRTEGGRPSGVVETQPRVAKK